MLTHHGLHPKACWLAALTGNDLTFLRFCYAELRFNDLPQNRASFGDN